MTAEPSSNVGPRALVAYMAGLVLGSPWPCFSCLLRQPWAQAAVGSGEAPLARSRLQHFAEALGPAAPGRAAAGRPHQAKQCPLHCCILTPHWDGSHLPSTSLQAPAAQCAGSPQPCCSRWSSSRSSCRAVCHPSTPKRQRPPVALMSNSAGAGAPTLNMAALFCGLWPDMCPP